jgi:type II secretory pathway pseudopilin PulG
MANRRKQNGISLPEMTVVIAIAALMVALIIPAINMLLNSFESQSGAKSIINSALASARAIAAKEQRYAGVRFQKLYDPNNPDILKDPQYIIFIINEEPSKMGNLTIGFRAVDGIQPIKLPDSIGVMDLLYDPNDVSPTGDGQINTDAEMSSTNILRDTATFSIIFSPSGKLIIHDVRTRNRDGFTATSNTQYSQDDIFNRISQITAGIGMFLQDDYFAAYAGNPVTNLGLGPEPSRNTFYIYETKKLNQTAYNRRWTDYLQRVSQQPVFVNPYTGTIVNDK